MTLDEWEQSLGRWATSDRAEPFTDDATDDQTRAHPGTDAPDSKTNSEAFQRSVQEQERGTPWLDSIEQSAMACEFEVLLNHGQYPQGLERGRDAMRVIHSLEDQLSVYRPTSDFSTVNRWAHERAVAVRFDVIRLLAVAQEISRATGRAFDITAGELSEVWGFSRRQGRKPADDELQAALQRVGSEFVSLDEGALTVRLERRGVKLNPGGIGKGYALDCMAQQLADSGIEDFLIHGGRSSVAARGDRRHGTRGPSRDEASRADTQGGWWIALAHPLRWEEKLGRIRLQNRALGTSGAGKQFFHYQGVRYSHVIDPRTGWPAQGILSATAICRSGTLADALATAFMVMGSEATHQFCTTHPAFSAVLVRSPPGSSRLVIERINLADDDWQESRHL